MNFGMCFGVNQKNYYESMSIEKERTLIRLKLRLSKICRLPWPISSWRVSWRKYPMSQIHYRLGVLQVTQEECINSMVWGAAESFPKVKDVFRPPIKGLPLTLYLTFTSKYIGASIGSRGNRVFRVLFEQFTSSCWEELFSDRVPLLALIIFHSEASSLFISIMPQSGHEG